MASKRPTAPRILPVEKVAAIMREREPAYGLVRAINLVATLAHNEPVRLAVQKIGETFFNPELLDPHLRELAVLRMGWDTQCLYEFGQHVLAARGVGVSEEDIARTTRPLNEGSWSPLELTALRLVDDIARDDCVSDEVWAELASMVDERQAIALVGLACSYRMVAGVINSLGVQPEEDLPGWPDNAVPSSEG